MRKTDSTYIKQRMLKMELPGRTKRGRPQRRFIEGAVKEDSCDKKIEVG